ncbi:MAG: hypothetical protein JW749_11400 [Sedimentisphaerales bacterium]|nr:hypothetical protein [Sedimentisphaerales bacterium]
MQNYYEMCKDLSAILRKYLLYFAILFLLSMLLPELPSVIVNPKESAKKLVEQENLIKVGAISIIPISQSIIALLASFFVHLELHTYLDKLIFKIRPSTNHIITNTLSKHCQKGKCPFSNRIINDQQKTMRNFYQLTDKMKPDLNQVFDRWGRYYLNLYLLLFSLLIVLGSLFSRFILPLNRFFLASLIFLLISIFVTFNVIFQLKPRLQELAEYSPSHLLIWNEKEVLNHLLSICNVKKSECPWNININSSYENDNA